MNKLGLVSVATKGNGVTTPIEDPVELTRFDQ